jgi:hypothetical protein
MSVIYLAASVVLADLVSGLVHWFEDVYVHRDMPLIGKWLGKVADDNRLHHDKPRVTDRHNGATDSRHIGASKSAVKRHPEGG